MTPWRLASLIFTNDSRIVANGFGSDNLFCEMLWFLVVTSGFTCFFAVLCSYWTYSYRLIFESVGRNV